jgi:hypothetical protein
MNIPDDLTAGPIVSVVAGIAAGVASITGLTTTIGLRPFWADAAATLFFLALAGYWFLLAWQSQQPKRSPLALDDASGPKFSLSLSLPHVLVAALFFLLALWFVFPILSWARAPEWKVCGTVTGGCSPAYCVTGIDHRSRPIARECVRPLDESGYFELRPDRLGTYIPATLRFECAGETTGEYRVSQDLNSQVCNGVLELP